MEEIRTIKQRYDRKGCCSHQCTNQARHLGVVMDLNCRIAGFKDIHAFVFIELDHCNDLSVIHTINHITVIFSNTACKLKPSHYSNKSSRFLTFIFPPRHIFFLNRCFDFLPSSSRQRCQNVCADKHSSVGRSSSSVRAKPVHPQLWQRKGLPALLSGMICDYWWWTAKIQEEGWKHPGGATQRVQV